MTLDAQHHTPPVAVAPGWSDPRYAARVAMWEPLTSAVTDVLLESLAPTPGERILDIGCGAGAATMRTAAAVGPDGMVLGIDIAPAIITEATSRMTGRTDYRNVSLHVADAQRDSFPGGPFKAALSQFGVMFFDDPVAAFTNIHRHLVPSGRLCFTCWQPATHNPWSFASALADLLPTPPAATAHARERPGPFSLADPDHVHRVLRLSGFHDIAVTPYRTRAVVPEQAVVDDTELILMGVLRQHLSSARVRVRQTLALYRGADGLLQLPLAFFVVTARSSPGPGVPQPTSPGRRGCRGSASRPDEKANAVPPGR